jgi:predicted nucleotidyltransferase
MTIETKVQELEQRLGAHWSHLKQARVFAEQKRQQLQAALTGLDSEDTSIVVSGSLARDEFTEGSDIDWTLLIDGSADPEHHSLYQEIGNKIRPLATKESGAEGLFGSMVFSHDLIHEIGGEDDTNRNTTRRLLLLLESRAVGRDEAYQRVVRSILSRYLLEDRGFLKGPIHVPRFLQNDFARYWRTMAVDFAYKLRRRAGKGWAIRNIKLRMSRKLIYVSGLLACFRCHLDFPTAHREELFGDPSRHPEVIEHLESIFRQTPLEIVAGGLLGLPHLEKAAKDIFDSYDEFVGILADAEMRGRLEELSETEANEDKVYQRARTLSHSFRDGLQIFFFDTKSGMDFLTKNYGVF